MDRRKKIAIILLILIILIVVYLIFNIYKDATGKNKNKDLIVEELTELNSKYSEAKAWLKIDNTSINMPVFQATNNDRYLRNNRDNEETTWGEVFLDYRCDLDHMYDKSNIIVYGHNTEEDTYFSSLLKYENQDFYKNNKIIKFSTLEKTYEFEIFAVLKTDTNYFYIDTNFDTVEEYDSFINELKQKSIYDTNVEMESNETILTLSTCDYTIENGRFVVVAKLKK